MNRSFRYVYTPKIGCFDISGQCSPFSLYAAKMGAAETSRSDRLRRSWLMLLVFTAFAWRRRASVAHDRPYANPDEPNHKRRHILREEINPAEVIRDAAMRVLEHGGIGRVD